MRARSFQGPVVLAASVVVGLLVAWGCGDDENKTPKCSELPLYNLSELDATDEAWPGIVAARELGHTEGCVTKPGTATTAAAGAPGSGGTGGSGGSGGAGGNAGSGGTTDAAAD